MAHKTLVNSTEYEVAGGLTFVEGTSYSIKNGKALIEGTEYDISFLPPIGTSLEDCTWEEIRAVSDAGLASAYFSVGNRKSVYLSGTVGCLTLSGTYYCYIIGIDHNASVEGTNRIHFQFGYTSSTSSNSVCFVDSAYYYSGSTDAFRMNLSNTNVGGWDGSYMRNTICTEFKNTLSSDLLSVLKTVTKYTDNKVSNATGSVSANVTATTDIIFLLATYEVFGAVGYANTYEPDKQAQYDYYKNGGSKIKYKHTAIGTAAPWSLRSPVASSNQTFSRVVEAGTSNTGNSNVSYGFAPCFCV